MLSSFMFNIDVDLPDNAGVANVAALYSASMLQDIDQATWDLFDCDDSALEREFTGLTLAGCDVSSNGGMSINAAFTVRAESQDIIDRVVESYMDGFPDSIRQAALGLYSRTGKRVSQSFNPVGWDCQVSLAA
jgi:hypothetical protein